MSSSCKVGRSCISIEERRSPWRADSSVTWGLGDGVTRAMSERKVRPREDSPASTARDSSSSKIAGFTAMDMGEGR